MVFSGLKDYHKSSCFWSDLNILQINLTKYEEKEKWGVRGKKKEEGTGIGGRKEGHYTHIYTRTLMHTRTLFTHTPMESWLTVHQKFRSAGLCRDSEETQRNCSSLIHTTSGLVLSLKTVQKFI